jgi:hypothetical protein
MTSCLQSGSTTLGASTCILRELNSTTKMGLDNKTEMLCFCASESADATLLILLSEPSCGSVVLGLQILAGFTGRACATNTCSLVRKESNICSNKTVRQKCGHLHSTWHEYLRRSGWSSVRPLKFAANEFIFVSTKRKPF